jgi:cyclopropane-fatty-acyl-phospholipid synthase
MVPGSTTNAPFAKRDGRSRLLPADRCALSSLQREEAAPVIGLVARGAEAGLFPDSLVRRGIRHLLERRLSQTVWGDQALRDRQEAALLEKLRAGPIALCVDSANEQHYEVPAAFFEHVLGPQLKYSCCYWNEDTRDLATAEQTMLELTASRACVEDGMRILDLGCGWGSFSLWAAERFPNATLFAVSNSRLQRELIMHRAQERGLSNVEVQTADINGFDPGTHFDRVVSIEMMEHVRNHPALFERIARWLAPDGVAFAHIFCHRARTYTYEVDGSSDWMAEHFFTGGMMPSESLFSRYQDHLSLREQWRVSGAHYEKTCNAWLGHLDQHHERVTPILKSVYGTHAARWMHRWRMFFMACAELFGYRGGSEWFVSHYRWERS